MRSLLPSAGPHKCYRKIYFIEPTAITLFNRRSCWAQRVASSTNDSVLWSHVEASRYPKNIVGIARRWHDANRAAAKVTRKSEAGVLVTFRLNLALHLKKRSESEQASLSVEPMPVHKMNAGLNFPLARL